MVARSRLSFASLWIGATLAVLACSPGIDAQLDEAQALVAAGQPMEALPLLQRVVQRHPDDGAANLLLGQVLLQTGRTRPAVAPLTRALASERFAVPAGLLLASAHLGDGRPGEALAVIDQVLAGHPDQPAALRIRATARLQSGDAEAALADARRIIEVSPEDAQGPLLLGTALTRLGRLDEAEQVLVDLETAARGEPDSQRHAHACSALATFLSVGRQDSDRAEAQWRACLAHNPADPAVVQGATAFFDVSGKPDQTITALRRALEVEPAALGMRLGLAHRLAAAGEPAEGEALLARFAEETGRPEAWQALALFRADRGDREGARLALDSALADPGPHADALRFQQANLLIDLGRIGEARSARNEIANAALGDLLEGRILLAEGEPVAALEAIDRSIAQQPRDARAHYLAGAAAQTTGDVDRALRSYATAIELDPTGTDAALEAARLHAALGEHAAAVELLHRHRAARASARRDSVLLEARATAALGEPQGAIGLLERWIASAGADAEALALLIDLRAVVDGPDAALERLDRAIAAGLDPADPATLPLLRSYGQHAAAAGQPGRARAIIESALAKRPEAPHLWVLEAGSLDAAGRAEEAEAAFDRALELAPQNPTVRMTFGHWLAARGRSEEALAMFDAAQRAAPGLFDASFQASRILSALGRDEEAERKLREVVRLNPLHAGACNDLAWLLAEANRELDFALQLARRAVRLQPSGATLDTLGWVHLHRGEFDDAIATLEQAVARTPDEAGFRYRLGVALDRAGRDAEARTAYQAALAQGAFPEAAAAREALSRLENGTS